jgi:opacity protein-like surface antigen
MANRPLLLAVLLVCSSIPAFSQVVPAAGTTGNSWPLSVGVAYSNYRSVFYSGSDFKGRLSGTTLWADWNFYKLPPLLDGFGIEVEARDLSYGRTGIDPKVRMDTIAGGVIYTTHLWRKFHPYGKFLIGHGSIDFTSGDPNYSHDTRTMYVPSAGADTRFYKNLWLRANYEYQFWPDFFRHKTFTPNGFDIGVAYDFGRFR